MPFFVAAFIVLLIVGLYLRELNWEHVARYLLVAMFALLVFWRFQWSYLGYMLFLTFLDGILVLVIFKGDVLLSCDR